MINQKENQLTGIGIDIDGVITTNYYTAIKKIINKIGKENVQKLLKNKENLEELSDYSIDKLYDVISELPCGMRIANRFYKKRKPNKLIVDLIKELKEQGHQIFLITGFSHRELAEEWLEKHNVIYDELFVREKEKSIIEHKIETIEKLKPSIYIDNSKEIIDALSLEIPEVRGFLYQETKIKNPEKIIEEIKEIVSELRSNNEPSIEFKNCLK